ncbi:GNAT family N-acetyltransferase [Shewanella sp. KJ2020]|uniref:GNAT family N-acetyltransferase n=1 Tax=Shewanella sp. KJ2020 TaxID=2919172 RepID=UPI0020A74E8F|nr:GNAT family N-acetyltransferase [Shewanella sp. KJ2020]
MKIRLATLQDIDLLVKFERKHLNDELASANMGLQGQAFSHSELTELVQHHWIVVAQLEQQIVGYVIAGRWGFFEHWPIYRTILNRLPQLDWHGPKITKANSCQYGPIWVQQAHRGQGVFEALVSEVRRQVAPHFNYMLTFIAEDNERSFAAHSGKAKMQVLDFFTVSARDYYLMVAETQR